MRLMLATNKEQKIKTIIEKHGKDGWLRVQECANEYAKDHISGEINNSLVTDFYRIRKRIEKGKIESLKILSLPGNVSYVGLSSADPSVIEGFISKDKKTSRNIKTSLGFFAWLNEREERKHLEKEEEEKAREEKLRKIRLRIAARRELGKIENDDPDYLMKKIEIEKKYGVIGEL